MKKISNRADFDASEAKSQLVKELNKLQRKALGGDALATMLLAICFLEFEITPDGPCLSHFVKFNTQSMDSSDFIRILGVNESWLGLIASVVLERRYQPRANDREVIDAESGRVILGRTNDLLWMAINFSNTDYCYKNGLQLTGDHVFFEKGSVDLARGLDVFKSNLVAFGFPQIASTLNSVEKTKNGLSEIASNYAEAMYLLDLVGDRTQDWLVKSSDIGFKLSSFKLGMRSETNSFANSNKYLGRLDMSIQDSDRVPPKMLSTMRVVASKRLMKLTIEDEVAKARAEAVENMMAMFAHQFRGAVGSIRFNAENQNDATIYIRLAQSMSGLLETFRIVSTTPEILADSFKSDCRGENSVECVLLQTIELVLAELLSKSSRPKISPYYRVFAQRNGLAPQAVSQSEWSGTKVWTTLEAELEAKWESEFSALVGSQDFAKLRRWLTEHFLPVQLNGFEASPIRFAEYGPKASLLTIVFAEMVANAIKYSIAGATGPITLSWNADTSNVTFTCTNPSTMETRQRAKSKGSGRGHKFLTIIANNLKGRFVSDVQRETSSSSFSFPSELVGANNE